MHGRWFHQKHYGKSNVQIAGDGINTVQALGINPKRRGIVISMFNSSASTAKFVAGFFGVNTPVLGVTNLGDFVLNSTLGIMHLKYDDWGEVLELPLQIFASAAFTVSVTEIVDSTPECECYNG